jgi:hypothetical protein
MSRLSRGRVCSADQRFHVCRDRVSGTLTREPVALQLTAARLAYRTRSAAFAEQCAHRGLHVFLAVLFLGSAQRVAASGLVIEWTAPPECPDKAHIEARVVRSFGDAARANLTATGDVTHIDQTNIGGRFSLLRFGARACRVWTLGPLDLACSAVSARCIAHPHRDLPAVRRS